MQPVLMLFVALHVVSAVFWAGSSFALARSGGSGAEQLFGPQMGASVVAIVTGGAMAGLLHFRWASPSQWVLGFGAACAIAAALVLGLVAGRAIRQIRSKDDGQAVARRRFVTAERIAAGLLAVAAPCMAASRYA